MDGPDGEVAIVTGSSSGIGDCAEAVLGLIRSTYVTGHVVVVDGGTTFVV
jgi:NADP-dependent 3-hydroxy acid dehydrogenase YdfG